MNIITAACSKSCLDQFYVYEHSIKNTNQNHTEQKGILGWQQKPQPDTYLDISKLFFASQLTILTSGAVLETCGQEKQ